MIDEADQRSYHGPLADLPNAVSDTLKPRKSCIGKPAKQDAGHSSFERHGSFGGPHRLTATLLRKQSTHGNLARLQTHSKWQKSPGVFPPVHHHPRHEQGKATDQACCQAWLRSHASATSKRKNAGSPERSRFSCRVDAELPFQDSAEQDWFLR